MKALAVAASALLLTAGVIAPAGASVSTFSENEPAMHGADVSAPSLGLQKPSDPTHAFDKADAGIAHPDDAFGAPSSEVKRNDRPVFALTGAVLPEPAAWILMAVGLGIVGLRLRKLNGPTQ